MRGEEMVTIAQAAVVFGVHPNTVRAWVKSGKIPSTKAVTARGHTYLIPRSALDHRPDSNPIISISDVPVSLPAPTQYDLDTSVSRIVEPFVARLQEASSEVGRLQERVRQLEAELEAARRPSWWTRIKQRLGGHAG